MRLSFHDGLGVLGAMPPVAPFRTCAVETAGAVLEWPLGQADFWQLSVLDGAAADWLWQLLGEQAHVQLLAALERGEPGDIEVTVDPILLAELQKIGYGHWLRRWWPTSEQLGIPPLDAVLLDAELAVLTAAQEQVLTPETLDGDLGALLAGYTIADLRQLVASTDTSIQALGRQAGEVVSEQGWQLPAGRPLAARADYALAAGQLKQQAHTAEGFLINGQQTVPWQAVPAGTFDAAEQNLAWSIDANPTVRMRLAAQLLPGGTAAGIGVQVRIGSAAPTRATLDASGCSELELPITAAQAWQLTPSAIEVVIGSQVSESTADRTAIREWALESLAGPFGPDRFRAERQAAELFF